MTNSTDAVPSAGKKVDRIYISGPITGMPGLNKIAFDDEESRLMALGLPSYNPQSIPAPLDKLEGKALWQYYMRECIRNLPSCSIIRMLPGWEQSAGAKEEKRIAEMLGLSVEYADPAASAGDQGGAE